MPLFDSYLVVDWSASSVPKLGRDSIWSARLARGSELELVNHRTRREFETWLRTVVAGSGRLLAGFDFSFGYPAGFAARIDVEGDDGVAPWEAVWTVLTELIDDRPDNVNNRFEVAARMNGRCGSGPGPFWGCPPRRVTPELSNRKVAEFPSDGIAEFRMVERLALATGRWISSPWQLLGAGSVGSQSLVGVPVLHRLRRDPPESVPIDIWPFTTGLAAPQLDVGSTHVVLAEVWPSMVRLDPERHLVRDAQQVIALVEHLAVVDAADGLVARFEPAVPIDPIVSIVAEEGWILGIGT